MLCAFPAGVVECQCPRFTVAALEKMDACPPDTRASDSPPSSCSSISMEIKKDKGRKECLIFLCWKIEKRKQKRRFDLWEIRFPSEMYLIHFPRPIRSTKQVKKCFFGCFLQPNGARKKKKTFAGEEVRPSDAAPLPLNAPYFSCQYTPSIHFHLADTFYWPGDE